MEKTHLLLTILCVLLPDWLTACPTGCRSCDNGRVLCGGAGLDELPTSIPEDTLVVDLTQNNIKQLEGLPNLPNVQSLRMPGNKLETLPASVLISAPGIMSLDLSQNEIINIDDNAFEGMTQVRTISLNANKIHSLGNVFNQLPAVTSIRLGNNNIQSIEEDNFKENTMLKMLDLSNNDISEIHSTAFESMDMLRYLILSNNPIVTLPDLVFTSTMLSLADFSNCQLTSVPRTMPPSLKDFRLGHNQIHEIQYEDFQNITMLTLLTLNDNKISNVAHRALGSLENLQELWLSRNDLVYIPRGLPRKLEKLYMGSNQVVELEPMLFTVGSHLKELSIESNKIRKVHQDALKEIQEVEKINLQGNQISLIDIGTFTHTPKLKSLKLTNNPIQVFETGAFGNLESLMELFVSYIDEPIRGREKILSANFLGAMPNLESLDLTSSPRLSRKFIELIAAADTATSESLKSIILQYNELEILPENIEKVFPNVEKVILDGNPWKCDSKLSWLHDWITTSEVTFHQYEEPTCNSPSDVQGKTLASLPKDDFHEVVEAKQASHNPGESTNEVRTDSQTPDIQESYGTSSTVDTKHNFRPSTDSNNDHSTSGGVSSNEGKNDLFRPSTDNDDDHSTSGGVSSNEGKNDLFRPSTDSNNEGGSNGGVSSTQAKNSLFRPSNDNNDDSSVNGVSSANGKNNLFRPYTDDTSPTTRDDMSDKSASNEQKNDLFRNSPPNSHGSSPSSGVKVPIKNPNNKGTVKKASVTKIDKAARKAEKAEKARLKKERQKVRKAERLRKKKLRRIRRHKQRQAKKSAGRKKRRIGSKKRGKRCKLDETGQMKCHRRKRCKLIADGSLECRKRNAKSQKVTLPKG